MLFPTVWGGADLGSHRKPTLAVVTGTTRNSGGGNVYEEALLKLIRASEYVASRWNLRVFSARDHWFHELEGSGFSPIRGSEMTSTKRARKIRFGSFFPQKSPSLENHLVSENVDLVYFTSLNRVQSDIARLPFITTIWDVGHRDLPEFPEFRGSTWDARERLFSKMLPKSFHIFTDSRQTSDSLSSIYSINPDRMSELGLLPSVSHSTDFGSLPSELQDANFFIYPAKMWPHKNHLLLLRAFRQLVDLEPQVKLVLTGENGGAQGGLVAQETERLGLEDRVLRLGFVDEATLGALIKCSVALVMPTFLGPTNIPPLQAIMVGTPAIVSDCHQFPPEIQRHLILVSPESESDWARAMLGVLHSRPSLPRVEVRPGVVSQEIERVLERFLSRRASWTISS